MKKISMFAMLFASLFIFIAANAVSTSAQGKGKSWKGGKTSTYSYDRWDRRSGSRRRNGSYMGYRNYGQYRRTQVGNRRYRMVRRSFWDDGHRVTRLIRQYY